jgi:hypothetical protein
MIILTAGSGSIERGTDEPERPFRSGLIASLRDGEGEQDPGAGAWLFLVAWVSLLAILMAAPEVYDQALSLPGAGGAAEIAFLAALTGFITLLAVSVVRRWRWAFWLILVAFLAGVLRVPVAILQLSGVLPANAPTWYVTFQVLIGLAQLALGLAMLAGYRRSGVWGAF